MVVAEGAVGRAVAVLVTVLAGLADVWRVAVVLAGAAEGVGALLSSVPAHGAAAAGVSQQRLLHTRARPCKSVDHSKHAGCNLKFRSALNTINLSETCSCK